MPVIHMPVRLPFSFAEAMSFSHKWEVRRGGASRLGVLAGLPFGSRANCLIASRAFFLFATRWNFEDRIVILRAIFKFSGID